MFEEDIIYESNTKGKIYDSYTIHINYIISIKIIKI